MAQILLIDDDDAVRTALRLLLTHFGHTVIEARNGREGLAVFDDIDADLLITDIVMPERDGLEVLMELHARHPPLKIIAISGGGRHLEAKDCLHTATVMGAAKVLVKPFRNEELMAAVNELLLDAPAKQATT